MKIRLHFSQLAKLFINRCFHITLDLLENFQGKSKRNHLSPACVTQRNQDTNPTLTTTSSEQQLLDFKNHHIKTIMILPRGKAHLFNLSQFMIIYFQSFILWQDGNTKSQQHFSDTSVLSKPSSENKSQKVCNTNERITLKDTTKLNLKCKLSFVFLVLLAD